MKTTIIPPITIGNLMQESTGKRISKDAKGMAVQVLEEFAMKITKKAILLAENNNRKTVKGKDIIYAYQQLKFNN